MITHPCELNVLFYPQQSKVIIYNEASGNLWVMEIL